MATSFVKKTLGLGAVDPAAKQPATDSRFPRKPKLAPTKGRKREIPEGLWTKCPKCAAMIFDKELDQSLQVCVRCNHHFPISARERIQALVEPASFQEMDTEMTSVDVLEFTGVASYTSKLETYQRTTGLTDAVVTGLGRIGRFSVGLGVMDFGFLGGSMGSVVGEKLTRLIEAATTRKWPVIIVSTSGGARMYEGMFSLMQMAKTCGALAYHGRARLPYLSVMASFASVGDLILAEPGAMIGFAGPRVIKDTTQAELPPGFQTAEFLLEHGLIDAIIPRKELKERLVSYLGYLTGGQPQPAGDS
jgi:acetyl-CoA carboxylase carboxyl transferase subunit beta